MFEITDVKVTRCEMALSRLLYKRVSMVQLYRLSILCEEQEERDKMWPH